MVRSEGNVNKPSLLPQPAKGMNQTIVKNKKQKLKLNRFQSKDVN